MAPTVNTSFSNARAISATYVQVMAHLVESHGGNSRLLIEKSGISRHQDNDFFSFITLGQYEALLEEAVAVTNNPALGLYLGKAIKFSDHGTFAYSALSFPTLWDAMKVGLKFSKLVNQIVDLRLEESDDFHSIQIDTAYISRTLYQPVIEMVMSLFCEILTFMLNQDISTLELEFCYKPPEYADQYKDVFTPSVTFERSANRVRIPKKLANKTLLMANPDVAKKFESECDGLIEKLYKPKSFTQEVHEALFLSRGRFPQLEEIALQMHVSPRTLRRRLQEGETSYKRILDDVRVKLANRYLSTTELSIGDISELLGYIDQNSFSHAYKQLTGMPPTKYRGQVVKNTRSKPC